uniref:Uncharacterized protein n=1 Tax=Stomoxys calcitrans TaxID=35570 RepID=A0A1I8PG04_STOCA
MAKKKIFTVAVVLAVVASLASLTQADMVEKSLMQDLANHFKRLGATTLCAVDQFDGADVPSKVDKVIEVGVGNLRQFLGKVLSGEEYIKQSILSVKTAAIDMGGTHSKCANVSTDYIASNTPVNGSELFATGKVLLKVSENLSCVVQKGDDAALDKVPYFYAKIINNIAADESDNQVNKLIRHEATLASDLGGLASC